MASPLLGGSEKAESTRAEQPRLGRGVAAFAVGVAAAFLLLGGVVGWVSLRDIEPPRRGEAATTLAALTASGRAALGPQLRSGTGLGPLSTIRQLAISAVEANSRAGCPRDVSASAAQTPGEIAEEQKSAREWIAAWRAGGATVPKMDAPTQARVEEVAKEVVLKAQDMAGVTAPLGFFDPLGFSTDVPAGKLLFYREAELKHGRVCMMASLGILVAEQFHPLFGGNIDAPAYVAFQQTPLQTFWPAVLIAVGILESVSIGTFYEPDNEGGFWMMKEARTPGNLGFDPLGFRPRNPKEWKEIQTKEINNGRLAMIAAAGMIAQEVATGNKIF